MTLQPRNENPVAPWRQLRRFTPARVALGRAGGSLPTREMLEFRLAHARAKDALLKPLDEDKLASELEAVSGGAILRLSSAAIDFTEYLRHPDRGRVLSDQSAKQLSEVKRPAADNFDLVVLVSEGLSALAAELRGASVVHELFSLLPPNEWSIAPVCLVRRARVALQDHAGEIVGARLALILLGERPGLVAPDSLGAYVVLNPRRGNTDANRNCISNISSIGLAPHQAAARLHWLLNEARRRNISGVELKDEALLGGGSPAFSLQPRPEV